MFSMTLKARKHGRGSIISGAAVAALLLGVLSSPLGAQVQTTSALLGTVEDPAGAVIPGAEVVLSSPALGVGKSTTTDSRGRFRFPALPPGTYTITATASGFRKLVQRNVILEVGRRVSLTLELEVGAVTQIVEVTAGAAQIDPGSNKAVINVSAQLIDALPKGRGFIGLTNLAPGARSEPAQGGFQIDGASRSENTYNVEGQNTTSILDGTVGVDPPTDFFQEVQVKSSGFEAEFGGAMGAVINATTKRGGSAWHGTGLVYYRQDALDADPRHFNRRNRAFSTSAGPQGLATGPLGDRISEPVQAYDPVPDDFTIVEPGFEVGGPIVPEQLFFYGSYIPRLSDNSRTVNITNINDPGLQTFERQDRQHFAVARLDGNPAEEVHLFAVWNYAYSRAEGVDRPFPDGRDGEFNQTAATDPAVRRRDAGFVAPNTTWRLGADWTPQPTLLVTGAFGVWNDDFQERGVPKGTRHFFEASSEGLAGVPLEFQGPEGFSTLGNNFQTFFDELTRVSGDISAGYTVHAAGTHTIKGGFTVNQLQNDILEGDNTAFVSVFWDEAFSPNTPQEQQLCAPVIASVGSCRGTFGFYEVQDFDRRGDVSSENYGLFIQDSWNMGFGFTLNAGIRFDKEFLPSFNADQPNVVSAPIDFSFQDKVAPRIGAAWDVGQRGFLKIFGSWGYFYDIMKYELPRGLFGGAFWHNCAFTLETADLDQIQPGVSPDGFTCNGGTFGGTPGIFLGEEDFRIPANTADNIDNVLDPGLDAVRQQEFILGAEWAITPDIAAEFRFVHKRLDNTIEDAGILGPQGEQFIIVNPGEGIGEFPLRDDCPSSNPACVAAGIATDTLPAMPEATREYNAFDVRINKRFTADSKWFLVVDYTWSRLHGNYSGLTSTDEDLLQTFGDQTLSQTAREGRASPNVTRYFDEQTMLYDAFGKPVFGPLPTDRPHTFKGFGGYRFEYLGMSTLVSFSQEVFQGVPNSSRIMYLIDAPFFPWGRRTFADITADPITGDWILNGLDFDSRTEVFSQSSLNFVHEFSLSETNEALRFGIEFNILNLFNEANTVTLKDRTDRSRVRDFMVFEDPTCVPGPCASNSGQNFVKFFNGFDPLAEANIDGLRLDSLYGQPLRIQNNRTIRLKLKVTF